MKKKLLFVITSFRHGGTNKSLENLLSLIDTDLYEVDVFTMEHYGPYKQILPNCSILPEDKLLSGLIAHWNNTKGIAKFRSLIIKTLSVICSRCNINFAEVLYKASVKKLSKNKDYDAIIAYSEGAPTVFLSHLNHLNKVAWIHCDYSSYMKLNNNPDEVFIYNTYKSIVCVSNYTKGEFCKILPSQQKKVFSIHNLLNLIDIENKSNCSINDLKFKSEYFTIITIGSFYPIKRLSFIPEIAKALQLRGCIFKWFIIANVNDLNEFNVFNDNIFKYEMDEFVIFLGERQNPYNYLKHSDLFVSLSTTEACPYVINESKALHIPIVCTNFPSAPEFVENEVIGFISPIEEVVNKLELLIKNQDFYNVLKANSKQYKNNNSLLLKNFYNIIHT